MSHRKLTLIFICGLILSFAGMMGATADGTDSVNEQEMTFKPIETKAGWIVEGSVGNMTFRTREMTFQSGFFHHARIYADNGEVGWPGASRWRRCSRRKKWRCRFGR